MQSRSSLAAAIPQADLLWRDQTSTPSLNLFTPIGAPCRIMVLSVVGMSRRMNASEALT